MLWKQFITHCTENVLPEPDHLQCDIDHYILNRDVVSHDQDNSMQIDTETGATATFIDDDYLDYANYRSESFLSEADGSDPNEVQVE